MNDKSPTIYDVAEHAGVSIATVSRVLSGGSASAGARAKVEEAISALGYKSVAAKQENPFTKARLKNVFIVFFNIIHNKIEIICMKIFSFRYYIRPNNSPDSVILPGHV